MLRLLGVLLTVLFAIATAILVWPQFFRLEQTFPFAQIVAARGVFFLLYLAIALLAVLLMLARPLRGFAASILIVAVPGAGATALIGFLRGPGPGSLPETTAGSVRVLTWNTQGEAVDPLQIAELIAEHEVDVVALPETSAAAGEQIALHLRERGRPMWVHDVNMHPEIEDGPLAWQTTLLISPDLGDYSVIRSSADGSSNTGQVPSAVVMPVDGVGPTIVAVHAVAPRLSAMELWRSDLRWVADQCPPDTEVILAGDFNATVDHMSALGVAGGDLGACYDAAARTGTGIVGTWPTAAPNLLGAPIDHVLSSTHWIATGSVILPAEGSDHRALLVQLEPVG